MDGEQFAAPVEGGRLGGWIAGSGEPVLLLHGGPGMGATYLRALRDELGEGYRTILLQQRGLAPSTLDGPFDVATAVADLAAVLDHLGIERCLVVGHSWGGHLAIHAASALPDRVAGALCLDPLGAVGDGGAAEFEAAMAARTPEDVRAHAMELDERAMRGEGTAADALESLRLVWPAYYADPVSAPPMPDDLQLSVTAYAGLWASLCEELPRLEAALPQIRVPVGFVAGAGSPMPLTASTDTADRIPGAWVEIVDGAGHMPWEERAGCVRSALQRLMDATRQGRA